MRLSGNLTLALSIVLCHSFAVLAQNRDGRIPRIGYVTDTSGPGSFFGFPATIGALLAKRDLGESGNPIEIIFEETANQPTRGISAAIKLIDIEKVEGILSDLTPVSVAIAPRVDAARIPLIYQSPARSLSSKYNRAFRNFIDYQEGCKKVAEYWKKGNKRIAIVAPELEFGELCYKGATLAAPGLTEYRYNSGDDPRTAISRFVRDGIDTLLIVGVEPDMISFYQQARIQKFYPQYGLVNLMSDKVAEIGGEALKSAVLIDFLDPPLEFLRKMTLFNPKIRDYAIAPAALAYNGVMALAHAIHACSQGDHACVEKGLRSAPQAPILGFAGWPEGVEPYPLRLIPFDQRR
jgi:ABC-type branched-subunit amino acid transport system substrate-binding protein